MIPVFVSIVWSTTCNTVSLLLLLEQSNAFKSPGLASILQLWFLEDLFSPCLTVYFLLSIIPQSAPPASQP